MGGEEEGGRGKGTRGRGWGINMWCLVHALVSGGVGVWGCGGYHLIDVSASCIYICTCNRKYVHCAVYGYYNTHIHTHVTHTHTHTHTHTRHTCILM